MPEIHRAIHPAELRRCYPVVAQLRPHLSEEEFLAAVQRQREAGYEVAFSCEGETVSAVAGFRQVLEAMMDPEMRRQYNRLKEGG